MAHSNHHINSFQSWQADFLQKRHLHKADGRPLYQYRITSDEFTALQSLLENEIRQHDLAQLIRTCFHSAFPELLVLYAAEWWRRFYDGHEFSWTPMLEDLGITSPDEKTWGGAQSRNDCITRGLEGWGLSLMKVGGKDYLGNIAIQAGLPLSLLRNTGSKLGHVLAQLVEMAKNTAPANRLERIKEELASYKDTLPKSYQHSCFDELLAQLVCTIVDLQTKLQNDGRDVIVQLDEKDPHWRNQLPVMVDDDATRNLLDDIVRTSLGQIWIRRLQEYTLDKDEWELVARIMDWFRPEGYYLAPLPDIYLSFDKPPLFIAYPGLEEEKGFNRRGQRHSLLEHPLERPRRLEEDQEEGSGRVPKKERGRPEFFDIEELLGTYTPAPSPKITLYAQGIAWHAKRMNVHEKDLHRVVLIHEIGHWITHQLPHENIAIWSLESYNRTARGVHEGWAQIITHWVVQDIGGSLQRTFEQLNRGQSRPYHVYKNLRPLSPSDVIRTLPNLRRVPSQQGVTLQDWSQMLGVSL